MSDKGVEDRLLCTFGYIVAGQYKVIDKLGSGSFSNVYKVRRILGSGPNCPGPGPGSGSVFALKATRNEQRFQKAAQTELSILKIVKENEYCIDFITHFDYRSHVCILFPVYNTDLYTWIKHGPLSKDQTQILARQLTKALTFLKSKRIVHSDLKPENIVVESTHPFKARVIDFGSACLVGNISHSYVQSRYYRAPEVVFCTGYECPIDMWSMALILCEALTRRPVFPAGSERELVTLYVEVLGIPTPVQLRRNQEGRQSVYFSVTEDGVTLLRNKDRKGRVRMPGTKAISTVFKEYGEDFCSFVSLILTWTGRERLTPEEALTHPYLTTTDV